MLLFADVVKFLGTFTTTVYDLRHHYSQMTWYNMILDEREFTRHGAAMQNKVEIIDEKTGLPTGEYRPVTTKGLKKHEKKTAKENEEIITVPKMWLEWMLGTAKWRDTGSKMGPAITTRWHKLRDKLSDKA